MSAELVYSDEYTDEMLLANLEAGLPPYAGFEVWEDPEFVPEAGQGQECEARRLLDPLPFGEAVLQHFKYKFGFGYDPVTGDPKTITDYLKIYWTERFVPYVDGVLDPDPGNWVDTEKTWTHSGGSAVTGSDVFTVPAPATNGLIYITNIRWSLSAGYVPVLVDEGCDPATMSCAYRNCQ